MDWYKFIAAVLLLAFLEGCCYKKECSYELEEQIAFQFSSDHINGFRPDEINNLVYVVYDPVTNERVDSSKIYIYRTSTPSANSVYTPLSINVLRLPDDISYLDKNMIIKDSNGGYSDTIFNIKYREAIFSYSCNTCLFNNHTNEVPYITDRSLTYHGIAYTNNDFPILITKK